MSDCRALSDPRAERQAIHNAWCSVRPEIIQKMGRDFPPWLDYVNVRTDKRCELYSYAEDGTVSVITENWLLGRVIVFGIDPYLYLVAIDAA